VRLYQLRFGGIGAFRDSFTIDFEAIGQGGLFLIEGATGTGKSTIIDAIVFALYGSVAGDTKGNGRLASDHRSIDSAQVPFAELIFETTAGIYRIRREHEYMRQSKKTGGAPVKEGAKAQLWRLASNEDLNSIASGEPLSSKPAEIGPMVEQIIGLTREQFGQTVVLPQGEFARFLTAKPEDRGELLQKLFGTEIYAKIAAELDSRRQEHEKSFVQADRAVEAQVNSWIGATSKSEFADQIIGLIPQGQALLERLDAEHQGLQEQAERCEGSWQSSEAARVKAEAELQRVKTELGRIAARRDLDERTARHEEARVTTDHARVSVQRITNSQVPLARHVDLKMAIERQQHSEQQLQSLLGQNPQFADTSLLDLQAISKELGDDVSRLAQVVELELTLGAAADELEQLEEGCSALVESKAGLDREKVELPAQAKELEAQLISARALGAKHDLLQKQVAAIQVRYDAAESAVQIEKSLENLESALAQRSKELEQFENQASAARRRYRLSAAAQLAADLVEGEACAVCGSTSHPQPAVPAADSVSLADVEAIEIQEKEARKRFDDDHKALTRAHDQLLAHQERAGSSLDAVDLELQAANREVLEASSAVERESTLVTELAQVQTDIQRLGDRQLQAERKLVEIQALISAKRVKRDGDSARVAAECAGFDSVGERVGLLEQQRASCDAVIAALALSEAQARETTTRRAQFHEALLTADLADEQAFDLVLAESADLVAMQEQVSNFDAEAAKISELAPTLADVDVSATLDLDGPGQTLEAAQLVAQQASEHNVRAREAVNGSAKYRGEVSAAMATLQALRQDSATERALAKLINGENPQKQTLPLYALRQQFNEVVSAANQRLQVMLGGRLLLEDHHESERNFRKLGVGLRVIDRNTGTTRETATLSGGESFCCSLALALGLADVVSAGQGGLRTETLFIDEGFGSLDQGTLDDVREELTRLRNSGRMVGVVSHVTEMKDAITHQIHVRRVAGGHSVLEVDFP